MFILFSPLIPIDLLDIILVLQPGQHQTVIKDSACFHGFILQLQGHRLGKQDWLQIIVISINLLKMQTSDGMRKNQSMISTHHMSCNQSKASNFYSDARPSKTPLLNYAHIPMLKDAPRWNQSSSTWRHSAKRYSFSKDSRFKEDSFNYSDIIQPQIPSFISSKSCTFGKGNRKPISEVVLRNAKEKPGPDRYDMQITDEQPRQPSKGKVFGLGWKTYEKTYLNHRSDVYAEFQTESNPPAKYQVREVPGKDQKHFTAYGRLKMYSDKMADSKNWVPGPHHKVNDRHLYGTAGLNQRNFAFGERMDLLKPANDHPAAIYHIPGFCDRFTKVIRKNKKIISSRT